jgi:MoaA/NifB/PqqE/SkfB family radical SAM enzyme
MSGQYDNPENIFFKQDNKVQEYFKKVIPVIENKCKEYGLMFENRLPVNVNEDKEDILLKDEYSKIKNSLCHLPWIQMYLEHDGTIRPDCNCMPNKVIGNIYEHSLKKAWNSAEMQIYRKVLAENKYRNSCNNECVAGRVSEMYLKFF